MADTDLNDDALREALDAVERKAPAVRLFVAIAHENGVTQSELAEWLDVERKTIYNWLTRFRESPEDLVSSAQDDHRPGRPRKLTGRPLTELLEGLREPPSDAGYEAAAWTPSLVQQHVETTYDVNYSLESCRRLLRDAGLVYQEVDESAAGDEANRKWVLASENQRKGR